MQPRTPNWSLEATSLYVWRTDHERRSYIKFYVVIALKVKDRKYLIFVKRPYGFLQEKSGKRLLFVIESDHLTSIAVKLS